MACDFGARETRQLCQRLSARLKPQGSALAFIYEFFTTENVKQLSPLLLALLSILRSSHTARSPPCHAPPAMPPPVMLRTPLSCCA